MIKGRKDVFAIWQFGISSSLIKLSELNILVNFKPRLFVSKLFNYVKENNICLIPSVDRKLTGFKNDGSLFQHTVVKSSL